jgi:hypothetical protein
MVGLITSVSFGNSQGMPRSFTTVPFGRVTESEAVMGIDVDLSGLERLQRNLEKVDGEHELTIQELMTDGFIRDNTKFETLQAFLDASGIKGQEDIGTKALDDFIATNTDFADWQEMFKAAGTDWMMRQLEL